MRTAKLAEEAARADRLAQENQTLQGRVQALLASPAAMEALREENELLKKQLAELRATGDQCSGDGFER